MSHEPHLVTDPELEPALRELRAREPIVYHQGTVVEEG